MTMVECYDSHQDQEDLLNSSLTNLQWLQHINMNLSESLAVPRKTVASSSNTNQSKVNTRTYLIKEPVKGRHKETSSS